MLKVRHDCFRLAPRPGVFMGLLCTFGLVALVPAVPAQSLAAPITMPEVTVQDTREQGYATSRATTATKSDAPILDIPQAIQVVPRQVIDEQRAITLSDVLRNVSGFAPSINSQSQRFGDRNAIFRGFTVNNYYTNGYKDPFNGTSFTSGLGNVDRVEVLKGPSSVLYGLGEAGATINLITKQPLPEWYASGSLTAGRFGFVSPALDVSGPLTPGKELRFRLNAAYQRQDAFVDSVHSERYQVAPVLALVLSPNTSLTLEGEYQALQEIYYTGLPALGTIQDNIHGALPRSRYLGDVQVEGDKFPERELGKIGYRLEHRFNKHLALRHGFRATFFKSDERDIIPFGLQEDQRTFDRELFTGRASWQDYYFLTEINIDVQTGPLRHQLLVGSDQRVLSTSQRSGFAALPPIDAFTPTYGAELLGPETPSSSFAQSGTFIGVYVQDLVTINDQFKLLIGGRYDAVMLDTESRNLETGRLTTSGYDNGVFTPRVGLVYQPVPAVALYASYAKSFNPLTGTTFDGSAFEPERGVQYEAGAKFALLGGKLLSTLAVYHLTRQNISTPDPAHRGFSIQDGEQRSQGFEFDLSGEVFPGFRLIASYAFTDAEITKSNSGTAGNRPANVPEHTGSLWGVYEFQDNVINGLALGLGIIAVGKRPADSSNTAELPSYIRTDAFLHYRLSKHLDFGLNIKNLFDNRYFETSTFADPDAGISPGAPLTVFGTVTARY